MSPNDQALALIKKSNAVAVALPEKAGVDEICSAAAALKILTKLGKNTGIFFSGTVPVVFEKLFPANTLLQNGADVLSDFVIEINKTSSPIGELRYQKTESTLSIIISPKDRPIKKEDIVLKSGKKKCDLLIAFGVNELSEIGPAFENSPELFYEKPLIAFSLSPETETVSEVSLADPARSSISEISGEFFFEAFPEQIDKDAATLFLLGIVYKTKNFRSGRVRPKTFAAAARLIERGALLDEIVRILWKTKPLPLLQLWGRAAVRSRYDEGKKSLIAVLTKDDFLKTNTTPENGLPFVLEHLEEHFLLPKNFALLWQNPRDETVNCLIKNPLHDHEKKGLTRSPAKEGYLEFLKTFASFQEAEKTVTALFAYNV
ncbi:MAG: hypothetical protein HYW90_02225 [Candidatus Sungbacteria bacterium]|nr:hypothetical protein [Candidatus Sungbacteria bacterium]